MNSDQAWQDGYDAFNAGEPLSDNPCSAWDSANYDAWTIGWMDARDDSSRRSKRNVA